MSFKQLLFLFLKLAPSSLNVPAWKYSLIILFWPQQLYPIKKKLCSMKVKAHYKLPGSLLDYIIFREFLSRYFVQDLGAASVLKSSYIGMTEMCFGSCQRSVQ